MMWQVTLEQVEVKTRVGILPQEREPQRLWVDVSMEVDYPFTPERISECADYAAVYNHIQAWKDAPHTDLLETLAHRLASFILTDLPRVSAVTCSIKKPDIFPHAKAVGVTLSVKR